MERSRIIIAANFTAEPVQDALCFWRDMLSLPLDVAFAPFDQVFQELLDPGSEFSRNDAQGVNVVLVKLDQWADHGSGDERVFDVATAATALERNLRDLVAALRTAAQRTAAPLLVVSCPAAPAVLADPNAATLLEKAEATLEAELSNVAAVRLVTSGQLLATYPVDAYYDREAEHLGAVPYRPELFAAVATMIARRIRAMRAPPYKVLVLDCDNTLWRGVVGEVGTGGIVIDDAFRRFHEFVLAQRDAGMLICVCSKNNDADVREVFESRDDMPLRWEHVTASRVNWLPKSENLASLAEELNLGLDSFVFVDDSAFEVGEVRVNRPEVLALPFPTEAAGIQSFITHCWAFDRLSVTAEDRRRSGSYQANVQRESVRREAATLDDYLVSLELRVDVTVPADDDFERMSQMTQRTNQFNVSTIRRDERELRRLCDAGALEARVVRVSDRFGDYGLVGLLLFSTHERALRVDTMLLSCRALGRRVEHQMLAELGRVAQARGLAQVDIPFVRSRKNTPALEFLLRVQTEVAAVDAEHVFTLSVDAAVDAPQRAGAEAPAPVQLRDDAAAPPASTVAGADSAIALTRIYSELDSATRVLEAERRLRNRHASRHGRAIVPPRNETERVILDAWQKSLSIDDIGVTDDYFDLGGTSLDAVPIFARLRREFGDAANPAMLFSAPTVEQLAAILTHEGDAPASGTWRSLVPIQPRGSHPPLFCLHAGAGSVLFYYPLARALGIDQPVYALQPRGLYGGDTPHGSVDEMVDAYLAEIRSVQPAGPYRFGGFCFGATLAFEIAHRLQTAGERVDFVASFDGTAPGFRDRGAMPLSYLRDTSTFFGRKWAAIQARVRRLRYRAFRAYTRRFGGPIPTIFRRFAWYFPTNIALAGDRYRPESFRGTMAVFTTKGRYAEPTLGWGRWVTGSVVAHEIEGEFDRHRDLMEEPMISDIVRVLREYLAQADEKAGGPGFRWPRDLGADRASRILADGTSK